MVSMARPFLADPQFLAKAQANQAHLINTCIGCNQACLDHVFVGKMTSCLVNPRACHEQEIVIEPTHAPLKLAVIGAGPAGLAAATTAAQRGHHVTLFDAQSEIGGQFNIAKQVPGKEEFYETIRYFSEQLKALNVNVQLNTEMTAEDLNHSDFDHVIIAAGIIPRTPRIDGVEHPCVMSYIDVLKHKRPVGKKVAIIGAGGIGFDTAEYLSHGDTSPSTDIPSFMSQWGIDMTLSSRGGIEGIQALPEPSSREIYLLQRKATKVGAGLGKTTGWSHRMGLHMKGVKMINAVTYNKIDDDGLHVTVNGETHTLAVDNVVICAGQEPNQQLSEGLTKPYHLIGGSDVAVELDAKRAIDQAMRLVVSL